MQKSLHVKPMPMQEERKSLVETELLNLPNHLFYQYCLQKFRINRGNYHTVEQWFYELGVTQIICRRLYILAFCDYVIQEHKVVQKTYLKFGKGGLSSLLKKFTFSYLEIYK